MYVCSKTLSCLFIMLKPRRSSLRAIVLWYDNLPKNEQPTNILTNYKTCQLRTVFRLVEIFLEISKILLYVVAFCKTDVRSQKCVCSSCKVKNRKQMSNFVSVLGENYISM